ncbi:hypothetical protein FGG08_005976 [Glutinoglossum americanum]|uniref:Aminoglycoside phosphotransferase domain-containing protein n=1 Tax=Glutinoglossum americanum TaxID=1670608 RepID=A0A9P8HX15_9PEZI|nr:hypothetical protein FGG08_005976 [Glutinoglossum americanum]
MPAVHPDPGRNALSPIATPIPSHNHSAVPTLKPGITDDDIAQAVVLSSFLGSPRKVVKVGSDMVAKLGPGLDLIEGEAMRFIRSHTGIPMPKVLDVFEKDGCGYILMEYVGGGRPDEVWHNLSADEQETIVSELSGYISQVGQIACPGGTFIRSVTGGPEADRRFSSICGGPFQSEADLNK